MNSPRVNIVINQPNSNCTHHFCFTDSEVLLIAHSDTVLSVNSSDGSDAGDPICIEDVIRVASDGNGGFLAATWNGSDSALLAFKSQRGNITSKTNVPNSHVDALAINLSDGSAIFSSGTVISSLSIGDSEPNSKVQSRDQGGDSIEKKLA